MNALALTALLAICMTFAYQLGRIDERYPRYSSENQRNDDDQAHP